MKKLIYSMLALAMTALTFTSCEDVPEPYDNPNNGLPTGVLLKESFAEGPGSFTVVTTRGNEWTNNYSTMTATGYDNTTKENVASESYLISPELDLSTVGNAYLQFKYIYRYKRTDCSDKVLITTAYSGDPTTTTWDDVTGELTEGDNWDDFSTYTLDIASRYMTSGVRIALYYSSTDSQSSTWEVKNIFVREGTAPTTGTETDDPEEDISGGTKDDPYTVAEALSLIKSGNMPDDKVYVVGTISQIKEVDTGTYGNATYYISDDGTTTNQFEIFRGYYRDTNNDGSGEKFTSESQIKVGQKVLLYGKLTSYNGTPEMAQGSYIVQFMDEGGSATTGGDGTLANPYSPSEALSIILAGNAPSSKVYIKGIISQIDDVSTSYGNATYYLSDDGSKTNQLEIFRGYYLDANNDGQGDKFTSSDQIKVGQTLVIYGQMVYYNNKTPEVTTGSRIISID